MSFVSHHAEIMIVGKAVSQSANARRALLCG